jgi:alkanesulfonate monooxygenase SsuD/methylene tetrahydromethanopterin reductase-like flavin-dependent oxidoreductase (luciferase family)
LEASVQRVAEVASAAGRPARAVSMSVLLNHVVFCSESQRIEEARRISTAAGLPASTLAECPYVLLGEPERMVATLHEWRDRLGLRAILLMSTLPRETADRLFDEVLARA